MTTACHRTLPRQATCSSQTFICSSTTVLLESVPCPPELLSTHAHTHTHTTHTLTHTHTHTRIVSTHLHQYLSNRIASTCQPGHQHPLKQISCIHASTTLAEKNPSHPHNLIDQSPVQPAACHCPVLSCHVVPRLRPAPRPGPTCQLFTHVVFPSAQLCFQDLCPREALSAPVHSLDSTLYTPLVPSSVPRHGQPSR